MSTPFVMTVCLVSFLPVMGYSQQTRDHSEHTGHQMSVDPAGVVMNENHDTLPRDCREISRDYSLVVHAGRKYAAGVPGMIFGMDTYEIRVQPCARVEITFVNEDQVRHQWMVHGLPNYLYPAGMFHIEASGGNRMTGTFIVPGDDRTYLVHCDMAQHMEKGMRGQLVVGSGSGNLWSVAGVSNAFYRNFYLPRYSSLLVALVLMGAFLTALWLVRRS